MEVGDKVRWTEEDEEATVTRYRWGGNDDPRELLDHETVYEVSEVEMHSWHTKIKLAGVEGQFNSSHFEAAHE